MASCYSYDLARSAREQVPVFRMKLGLETYPGVIEKYT
jgi:hypothetical protein